MFSTILSQLTINTPADTVKSYKYFLQLANRRGDIQTLIAEFNSCPSFQDWQDWLSDWTKYDYYLSSRPVLLTK